MVVLASREVLLRPGSLLRLCRDRGRLIAMAATIVTALSVGTADADSVTWPDTPVGRVEALAVLQTLNAELLSHDSATLTLDRWCGAYRLAETPRIVASLLRDIDKPATAEQRQVLGVGPDEPIRYRRVALRCGSRVLSEADNWYVPSRLTPQMNQVLDTTDTAFGRAVKELNFQRRTLSAALLWEPLPPDWDMGAAVAPASQNPLAIPDHVLQHRAMLTLPNGTPFSLVVETYTKAVLDFRPPLR